MKFKFSLDSVLKVRKHQQKVEEQKLAEELMKKKELDQLKQNIADSLNSYIDESKQTEAANIHQIKRHSIHLEETHRQLEKLSGASDELEKSVKKVRKSLMKAHKKRHILEVVKDFEKSLFIKDQNQKEQKNLDEISTQSYTRL